MIPYWKLLIFVLMMFQSVEDIEHIDLNDDYFHQCYFVDNGSLYLLRIYSGIDNCSQIGMTDELFLSSEGLED